MTRRAAHRASRLLGFTVAATLLCGVPAAAQDVSGRWLYEENGQTAELNVRHDRRTGKLTGTFSLFGQTAPFEGAFRAGAVIIDRLGDVRASAENGSMTGSLQGGTLMFTIVQPGQAPVTLPMTRRGDSTPAPAPPATGAEAGEMRAAGDGLRAGEADDFAGRWELTSDDGTSQEVVELAVRGGVVTGEITAFEHGYFSRRTTVKGRMLVRGTLANGALQMRFSAADASPNESVAATGRLRGEYLVVRSGETETGYARPGRPLVRPAEGSADAAALARAVVGRIYSKASQAAGRGGGVVGARVRFALCADGRIELDASDVGSVPLPLGGGMGMGDTMTRRGQWSVVLVAGAPAVQARWHGTGTSYSLTAYFRVVPDANGRAATVDGVPLAVTGRC